MGCFDSTCCLTGLPIKENDPIRIGLIVESNSGLKHEEYGIYPATSYSFLTPAFSSVYNDYGNLKWSKIDPEHLPIVNMFVDIIRLGLGSSTFGKNDVITDETTNEKVWDYIVYHHFELDPNKELRENYKKWENSGKPEDSKPADWPKYKLPYYGLDKTNVNVWMCHSWAFDHVRDMHKLYNEAEQELDQLLITRSIAEEALYEKYPKNEDGTWTPKNEDGTLDKDADYALYKTISPSDLRRIFDDQGAFDMFIRRMVYKLDKISPSAFKLFVENKDQFRKLMQETLTVTLNMRLIRKIIHPVTTCGMQHDNYKYLSPWTKLVNEKLQDLKKTRDEEYGS
jgi:hypothetical protein